MALDITVLTGATLTATVEGNAILASIVASSATLEINMGVPGPAATVQVGTTTTGTPGTDASVTNSGTTSAAILNFTIPRGDKGEQGNAGTPGTPGTPGSPGTAATINVGTTTTGSAGSSASVTNSGSTSAAVFNFTIPRGDTGNPGVGVPTGGTSGQALVKLSGTSYDTGWASINSAAWGNITGTLSSQTDLYNALNGKLSLSGGTMNDGASITLTQFVPPNPPDFPLSFTKTVTISGNEISGNQDDPNIGDYNFLLNTGGVSGTVNSEHHWSIGNAGAYGGYDEDFFRLDGNGFISGKQDIDQDGVGFTKALGLRFSDGTYQSTAGLPLTGGSMSGDIIFPAVGTGSDSAIGTFGFGTENLTLGQTAYVEPAEIRIQDSTNVVGTALIAGGISFNDATVQTTAGLPLTGGTLTGDLTLATDSTRINITDGAGLVYHDGPNDATLTFYDGLQYQSNRSVNNSYWSFSFINFTNASGTTQLDANGITFPDTTIQTTAYDPAVLNGYLPLTGGTMSGSILFDAVGGQNIAKGSFDSGRGGYNGISLNCAVGVELNWQAGFLKAVNNGGSTVPINVDESNVVLSSEQNNEGYVYRKSTSLNSDGIYGGWNDGNNDYFFVYNVDGFNFGLTDNNVVFNLDGISFSGNSSLPLLKFNSNRVGLDSGNGFDGWSFGADGAKFVDGTNQTTAFIPGHYLSTSAAYSTFLTQSNASSTYYPIPTGTTSQYIRGNGSLATFPSIPVFPPAGGTTSQYIRGDGSVATYGPLGDRYLTSSTSTMTCDSGNGKTMTVGTGLSYSRQQDITVSYNTANHMHGTVLTYDSATGVMTFDSNTHSGSGTYSSWEVNVGGVAGAVLPVGGTSGQVLAKINSTNFNTEWKTLGTMSTEPASAYLSTASAVANYQTISGMSAYLSTSAASSTYLTQSNASSTYLTQSSASSTYIAQASFATTAQAQAGTSTTTVINPSTLLDAKYFAGGKSMVQIAWSTSVSGAGAGAYAQNSNARLNVAPTTATGYAIASTVIANNSRGSIYNSGFDFSKRIVMGLRVARNVASPDTNSVFRFSIGKISGTDASDLSARGLMIKVSGSGALQLLVHNGSGLTSTTSSFTPVNGQAYDVIVTSDGAGNCALFVNGSSVATSTGGPTTSGTANAGYLMFEVQNTATISGSPQNICVSDYYVQVNS
jgi:hypothetical protein